MARARGIYSGMALAFEAVYGTPPGSGYKKMPFVNSPLGAEQALIEDDLLGYGRDPLAPSRDVINVGGDVVVPVDLRAFGWWLKLLFGAPSTTNVSAVYTHVFASGGSSLPSAAIEMQNPEVPAYAMNKGVMANTLSLPMRRSGLVQATIGLIGQDETPGGSSGAGSPSDIVVARFNQFQGSIKKDGAALGNVVSADLTYSNNLEPVEVLRGDGLIGGADPGKATFGANITVRFDSLALFDQAIAGTADDFEFGYQISASAKLTFALAAGHLPRPKRTIAGPQGIQATFAIQGARPAPGSGMLTATLINDVTSYA